MLSRTPEHHYHSQSTCLQTHLCLHVTFLPYSLISWLTHTHARTHTHTGKTLKVTVLFWVLNLDNPVWRGYSIYIKINRKWKQTGLCCFSPPFFLQKRMARGSLAAAREKNTTAYAMTQSPLLGTTHQPVICVFLLRLWPRTPCTRVQGLDLYSTILSLKKEEDWFSCIFSTHCSRVQTLPFWCYQLPSLFLNSNPLNINMIP